METEGSWARFRPAKQAKPPSGPRYYRHWGPNFRDKPAVGIGHFALWRNRFLEGPPRTAVEFRKKKTPPRPSTAHDIPTPAVAEDWADFNLVQEPLENLERLDGTPLVQRGPQTPQMPTTPRPKAHREERPSIQNQHQPSQRQRVSVGNSDVRRKHGRIQGGIVPIATSEPPSFGYGIPAVLKPLPPCAVATDAVEAVDLPPEERFLSTYRDQFQKIPLEAATFQTPDYLPMRFVPAANRHVKDIALNVIGAHVARKG